MADQYHSIAIGLPFLTELLGVYGFNELSKTHIYNEHI